MRLPRRKSGLDRRELGETWQPKLWLALVALALVFAYLVAFVVENNKQVSIHFVAATARISLIWAILLSLAIGVLAGLLLSQLYRRRGRRAGAPPTG
ncbi:MAG TPA: LapA family protein [Gaiellaceae bacterium]